MLKLANLAFNIFLSRWVFFILYMNECVLLMPENYSYLDGRDKLYSF